MIEAISTGYNFITDIVHRGYHPVVLELNEPEESVTAEDRKIAYAKIKDPFEIIQEQESYEKTLALVKTYDPVVILAGAEEAVYAATQLSEDLGLPGNPMKNIDKMIKKDAMHMALKEAGMRYIKGEVVTTPSAALDFCRRNDLKKAVVKPLQSAASQGLFLCDDLHQVHTAVEQLLQMKDLFGNPIREVLIQERIEGTEYIVNTMSSAGKHRLSSFFRYRKAATAEGGRIYDNVESISCLEPGHNALIEYALQTAEAIGIRYGSIHGEYMVDEKGPVLIEVNCRPMGCGFPAGFMDQIYGQHETDSVLDAYLAPGKFAAQAEKTYRPLRKGYIKLIMVPENIEAESLPVWTIAENLRSTYKINVSGREEIRSFIKTRDLESAGGTIFLVHDDPNVVEHDLNLLTMIEKKYFSFLLNDGMSRRWFPYPEDPGQQIDLQALADKEGSTLIVTQKEESVGGALLIHPREIGKVTDGFDQVIIDLGDLVTGINEVRCLETVFAIMKKAKVGGHVLITPECWQYFSYQREGAELLLSVLGYTIEAPLPGQGQLVIGTRY